ncbi:MAG: hypothetical protein AMJ95_02685 [Omnitrophica WOR_2 bacterium SM23_72]|nr:MAG: hypothetical protein AMJ95_02685 [Omnitrophica WOR_2 bacterium SM23_72]
MPLGFFVAAEGGTPTNPLWLGVGGGRGKMKKYQRKHMKKMKKHHKKHLNFLEIVRMFDGMPVII